MDGARVRRLPRRANVRRASALRDRPSPMTSRTTRSTARRTTPSPTAWTCCNSLYATGGPYLPVVVLEHELGHRANEIDDTIGPISRSEENQADCDAGVTTAYARTAQQAAAERRPQRRQGALQARRHAQLRHRAGRLARRSRHPVPARHRFRARVLPEAGRVPQDRRVTERFGRVVTPLGPPPPAWLVGVCNI